MAAYTLIIVEDTPHTLNKQQYMNHAPHSSHTHTYCTHLTMTHPHVTIGNLKLPSCPPILTCNKA